MHQFQRLSLLFVVPLAIACATKSDKEAPSSKAAESSKSENSKADNGSEMGEIVAALDSVSGSQRPMLAAAGLRETIGSELPPAFVEGLDAFDQEPRHRRTLLAAAIANPETLVPLNESCAGNAASVLANTIQLAPAEKVPALWSACDFGRHKLISESEARSASAMSIAFAHALLAARGGDKVGSDERKVIRALISK